MSIPTNIDGILIKRLRPAIDSALTEIGERFGVVLEAGNASYARDGKSGHFKLEVTAVDESGEAVNLEAEAFKKYAHMYGLKPEDLGSEITLRGTKYTIAGFRPKARKNNVSVTDKNGKVFVVPAVRISSALKQGVRP